MVGNPCGITPIGRLSRIAILTMKNYLDELNSVLLGYGNIDVSDKDFNKIEDKEKVVANCSPRVKLIASFMYKLQGDLDDREACLEATDKATDPREYARFKGEAYLIRQKMKATGTILWITVHEENPELTPIPHLTIRKGWKIVSCPEAISIEDVVDEVLRLITVKSPNGLHGKN